eukprot:2941675-Pleurochrysis_carterae.AAC.2
MEALDTRRVDCDGGEQLELALNLFAASRPLELVVLADMAHPIGGHQEVQAAAETLKHFQHPRQQLRREACLGLLASASLNDQLLANAGKMELLQVPAPKIGICGSHLCSFQPQVASPCSAHAPCRAPGLNHQIAEGPDSAASGATEAKIGSNMHPENGTESHLNSNFSSAAASSMPPSSASFLRLFSRYLNHSSRPTDFCFHLPPSLSPSLSMQLTCASECCHRRAGLAKSNVATQ